MVLNKIFISVADLGGGGVVGVETPTFVLKGVKV